MRARPLNELRDSGSSWLGAIPSSWNIVPLWTLFRRVKRTGYEGEQLLSVYRDFGVVPKASRDDNFNKPSDDLSPYQLVEPGDLAINKMKAWQGSVAVSEFRGIVSPAYFIFQASHSQNNRYLHYLLRSAEYTAGYLSISKGIRPNQWDLEPQEHSRMPVLLPPLPEQNAIAAFLDRETGKIDALVEEHKRLIELLKEKRQAVISRAVTKGLDPNARMRPSGVEWLGDVPEHWEVLKFSRCVSIAEGQVNPEEEPFRSMPLIAPNHIESCTGRLLGLETAAEQGAESGKYLCRRGDVIYSKIRPALAKAVIAPTDTLCSADMYPMRGRIGLSQEYLFWLLLTPEFTGWAVLEADRVAMPKINRESLAGLRLPVPSPTVQASISRFLDVQTRQFDGLLGEAEKAVRLLQERRSALISSAVTGKIDVSSMAELVEAAA